MKILQSQLRDIVRPNELPDCLNVAVTGGIGSGKSTVARALQARGAALVDFDAISRRISAAGGAAIEPLRRAFGEKIIDKNGALNRTAMRQLIFQKSDAKKQLEHIMHPIISAQAVKEAHALAQSNPSFMVYDIPLLVGNQEWLDVLDFIVYVSCEREVRIERVLKRNTDYAYETVVAIINAQPSHQEFTHIANIELENSTFDIKYLQLNAQLNILMKHINNLNTDKHILQ